MTSGASAAPDSRPGIGGVDQDRLIGHVGMARGRGVHLLLEHALVDRGHRPLRPAVHACAHRLGGAEGELGHRAAGRARDPLGAQRDLVGAAGLALAPLLGAVGVLDRHAHDRDRVVHAGDRLHARQPAARCGR